MTAFALAAALTVLTVALLVVLLERDLGNGAIGHEAYESAKRDLKHRVLEDSTPDPAPAERKGILSTVALAAIVPIAAASLYLLLGNPAALDPQRSAEHPDAARIEAMILCSHHCAPAERKTLQRLYP